jgi:hypothetical protein
MSTSDDQRRGKFGESKHERIKMIVAEADTINDQVLALQFGELFTDGPRDSTQAWAYLSGSDPRLRRLGLALIIRGPNNPADLNYIQIRSELYNLCLHEESTSVRYDAIIALASMANRKRDDDILEFLARIASDDVNLDTIRKCAYKLFILTSKNIKILKKSASIISGNFDVSDFDLTYLAGFLREK